MCRCSSQCPVLRVLVVAAQMHPWSMQREWRQFMVTARVCKGGGGGLSPTLETAQVGSCPLWVCAQRKRLQWWIPPPDNDTWPLWWPGLPPCTPSVVVTLDSNTISQAVSAQPILVLSPGLISESLSSNNFPAHTGRLVFQVATKTICTVFLLFWLLHSPLRPWSSPSVLADLAGEGASQGAGTLPLPQLPPRGAGLNPFLSQFLVNLFSCPVTWRFLALSAVWGILPVFSRYSVRTLPHVDVFLHLWEKGSFTSYHTTILTAPQVCAF